MPNFSSLCFVNKKCYLLACFSVHVAVILCILFVFVFSASTDSPSELVSVLKGDNVCNQSTVGNVHLHLPTAYVQVLQSYNQHFFLIEPFYLVAQLNAVSNFSNFKSRFSGFPVIWPPTPPHPNSPAQQHLSVGVFAENFEMYRYKNQLHNFYFFYSNSSLNTGNLISTTYINSEENLHLHVVLFYRFQGYFQVDFNRNWQTNDENQHPQPSIFDPFDLLQINDIAFPDDIEHYISQLPTSSYIECTSESRQWMMKNQVARSPEKELLLQQSIIGMKALSRRLRMEVWIVCGTLLGWYRQCSDIPSTTDTDFASWSFYVNGKSLQSVTTLMKNTAANETSLRLLQRFGTPSTGTLEFSFATVEGNRKADLFFVYPNQILNSDANPTNEFFSPLHFDEKGELIFQRYPSYSLCSVVLLGIKVLAPCTPRDVIFAEYGPMWMKPDDKWNYLYSPKNFVSPGWIKWSSFKENNEIQYERFLN